MSGVRRGLWILVLGVGLFTVGCGDDASPADTGGDDAALDEGGVDADGDADADPDADADADEGGTGTVGVLVLGMQPLFTGTEWPPVPDAAVALDLPGGGRTEAVTDAAGRASFTGLDWTAGTAAVTAWAEGYGLASIVGLDGTDAEVALVLPTVVDPFESFVDLTINFLNVPVDADAVGAVVLGQWRQDSTGSPWSVAMGIAPGRTVPLATLAWAGYTELPGGHERAIYGTVVQELGPYSAPATLDVDFASALSTTTISGSFALPARAGSPLRTGAPDAVVMSSWTPDPGTQYLPLLGPGVGWPTRIQRATDGNTVDYEMVFVMPGLADSPLVRYSVNPPAGGGNSFFAMVDVDGYPTAGLQTFAFLDLPEMTDPADPTVAHPLHTPFVWELFDTGVTPTLQIHKRGEGIPDTGVWWITAATDATTLTVPEPPSDTDVTAVLGTGGLFGALGIRANDPGDALARYSQAKTFLIQP